MMEPRERFRWLAHQALLLFILLAVAFLSGITAMRFAIQGHEVEMPKLSGLKAGDAQALLASRQLGFRIADRIFSAQPKDTVVLQSPPPGTRVKKGQRGHVILSLGPQQVTIPALEGGSIRAARIELLRSGLQVGELSNFYSDAHEPGFVLLQNPPPASKNAGGPRVNLLVSLGPREAFYVMPDVTGLPIMEAQRHLSAVGLRLAKITSAASSTAGHGAVIAQSPERGAKITTATPVELQIVE